MAKKVKVSLRKEEKKKIGRPSKLEEIDLDMVTRCVSVGMSVEALAHVLNVTPEQIYRWKKNSPSFCQAFESGAEEADAKVQHALYQKATGVSVKSAKFFYDARQGKVIVHEYDEHFAPNQNAIEFWLTNRKPKEWKHKNQVQFQNPNGEGGDIVVTFKQSA